MSRKETQKSRIFDNVRNFFRHNICHTCKQTSNNLKRCSGCRVLAYCSREHQKQDWPNHKTLCRVIAREDLFLEYNVSNPTELRKYKEKRGMIWHIRLARELSRYESQMFMFPRVCAVCYKREIQVDCSDCLSEFYCSKEHQGQHSEAHKKMCKDLKLSLDIDCYYYHHEPRLHVFTLKRIKEELKSIPENRDFINSVLKSHIPTSDFDYINCCDFILSGFTILFALEQAGVLENRKLCKKSLEIHIVGATSFDCLLNWLVILEIYFHWIHNLEEVHVVFIGPEVPNKQIGFQLLKTLFCQKCQNKKSVTVKDAELHKGLYHEKVARLERPDVVVAFNSGLHEFAGSAHDLWKDSLSALIRNVGVPLVLTAYTEDEIEKDLGRITDTATVDVVYGPKRNPFSNVKPCRDWETDGIYFVNQFMAVIKKKC